MDRIAQTFARCKAEGRPAFVSYVCAGDPDAATSKAVLLALAANGADILEVGVPFSDPLADGLTNQLAAQRALEGGMTYDGLLDILAATRAGTDKPIVLYCYYNLLFSFGVDEYCRKVKAAGADGLLVLDCPPEEAGELIAASRKHGLANIFIVAPTTPPARVALIAQHAGHQLADIGFIVDDQDIKGHCGAVLLRRRWWLQPAWADRVAVRRQCAG